MLELMAEKQVSIGGQTYPMPQPFIVIATQNPIESEGVYPLPEAQRDRFLLKVDVPYPRGNEEFEILRRMSVDPPTSQPVLDPQRILQLQRQADDVFVHNLVAEYIVRLVLATRTPAEFNLPRPHVGDPDRLQPARDARPGRRGSGAGPDPRPRLRAADRRPGRGQGRDVAPPGARLRRRRRQHLRRPRSSSGSSPWCRRPRRSGTPRSSRPAARRNHHPAQRQAAQPGLLLRLACRIPLRRSGSRDSRRRERASRRPAAPPVQFAAPAPAQAGAAGSVVGEAPRITIPLNKLAPEAALRRLELTIVRRLEGFLHGDHLGLLPGPGSEINDARVYQPGEDDVRRIDWAVTARTVGAARARHDGRPRARGVGPAGRDAVDELGYRGRHQARPRDRRHRDHRLPEPEDGGPVRRLHHAPRLAASAAGPVRPLRALRAAAQDADRAVRARPRDRAR